ncbi:MAG: universal stress protein [Verrucomicrobia bacterium]|nr:universal stress protein [Verrucomicrobiota bacterium]MDE3099612.1 universal stress protein [Verrucomicrobiota bacterium]
MESPRTHDRISPDDFLRLIEKSRLGKLKIYLGHAAGVGKTYEMLQEAHRLKKAGVDVVIGWIETHGRKETEALLEGLEIIPPKKAPHGNTTVEVLDVEAIFKRYPTVCVIDELPYTNVAGSQHPKRYLEVHDLLLTGINVITALNIQHLESLHDTVLRATGVDVRERVPDRFVLEADQIVNVDLTAEELRERMKQGKIYPPDRVAAALDNFFTENNLNELRELALRETANALDRRPRLGVKSPPDVSEKIAVFISTNPATTAKLLRAASRLAGRLNREWIGVYVRRKNEDPMRIPADLQRQFMHNAQLATELGGSVTVLENQNVCQALLKFCREQDIHLVVLGTSERRWWQFTRPNVLDFFMHHAPGIDLHIVDPVH